MSEAPQAGPAPGELSFDEAEYRRRLDAVRQRMAERGLDVCLISTPENIFYLTGLDHWGYFAAHVLLVPADGEMTLVTRAMEKVTIAHQVRNAWFAGHEDHETAADVAIRLLSDRGFAQGRLTGAAEALVEELGERAPRHPQIGLELWSAGLPYGLAAKLMADLPDASWVDVTGLVDALRLVKSPAEQRCMRAAARVSDAAMAAASTPSASAPASARSRPSATAAMIGPAAPSRASAPSSDRQRGSARSTRPGARAASPQGDAVFLELSGCVARYHAPLGRLVFLGAPSTGAGAWR